LDKEEIAQIIETLDYKQDVVIDPDSLDVEWLDQPERVLDYSLAQSNANLEKDEAKLAVEKAANKLKEVKAEVTLDARNHPGDYNLDKVTDASVEAAVLINRKVKEAKEDYYKALRELNEAWHHLNLLISGVKSMEQRKTSLENLVRLLGMQYFAAPNVERNLAGEYEKYRHKRTAHTKKIAKKKIRERRRTK
jgi:hypothetical protein